MNGAWADGGGEHSRRRRSPWFMHRTVVFLAVLALAWTGWSGYDAVTARRKIDPGLLQTLGAGQPVNLWVELPFPPEEFHIRYLQDRGTVSGVQNHWIHLLRVRPAVAWSIARLYWVRRLKGEPGPYGTAGTVGSLGRDGRIALGRVRVETSPIGAVPTEGVADDQSSRIAVRHPAHG